LVSLYLYPRNNRRLQGGRPYLCHWRNNSITRYQKGHDSGPGKSEKSSSLPIARTKPVVGQCENIMLYSFSDRQPLVIFAKRSA
jgi:hypothetical protein